MSDRTDNRCVAKGDIKEGQPVRYISRDNMNIVTACEPEFAEAIALLGALDGHTLPVTKLDTEEVIDQSIARLMLVRERIKESRGAEYKSSFVWRTFMWRNASNSIRETGGIIDASQSQQHQADINEDETP